MKYLLILLIAVTAVAAEYHVKTYEQIMHYHDECGKENNVPAEHVDRFKHVHYNDDHESHCHAKCVAEKIGIYDDEHGFLADNFVEQTTEASHKTKEEVRAIIDECKPEVEPLFKDDKCKYAIEGFRCARKHHLRMVERPHGHEEHHHEHKDHDHKEHEHKDHEHKDHEHKDDEHKEHKDDEHKEHEVKERFF